MISVVVLYHQSLVMMGLEKFPNGTTQIYSFATELLKKERKRQEQGDIPLKQRWTVYKPHYFSEGGISFVRPNIMLNESSPLDLRNVVR